jgi:hypothetical protein
MRSERASSPERKKQNVKPSQVSNPQFIKVKERQRSNLQMFAFTTLCKQNKHSNFITFSLFSKTEMAMHSLISSLYHGSETDTSGMMKRTVPT